tara:strand:+ start:1427 stop:2410 length:984 start_codon:yes stop_codon:yes gene_type:complete
MRSTDLILCLSDGEFHSGADIGLVLGVSRAAVWKQVQKLDALGLSVESVKGRGYRIEGGLDLLDKLLIDTAMNQVARSCVHRIDILHSVESTNSYVMEQSADNGGNVCLAEQQTAGRGRRGRTWVSPYGKNLYLSCSWVFENGAAVLEGLSLAVGVALVRALEACNLSGVVLKWPNDLLWCGRKVAGVLLEVSGDATGRCQLVVGIGLNVSMSLRDADKITQPWVDLNEIALANDVPLPSRSNIAAEVLNQLLPLLRDYSEDGFSAWRDDWMSLDAYRGREVRLTSGVKDEVGVASGVDSGGALLLERAGKIKKFSGGELSLRLLED